MVSFQSSGMKSHKNLGMKIGGNYTQMQTIHSQLQYINQLKHKVDLLLITTQLHTK